jgi:hypothetical protein
MVRTDEMSFVANLRALTPLGAESEMPASNGRPDKFGPAGRLPVRLLLVLKT